MLGCVGALRLVGGECVGVVLSGLTGIVGLDIDSFCLVCMVITFVRIDRDYQPVVCCKNQTRVILQVLPWQDMSAPFSAASPPAPPSRQPVTAPRHPVPFPLRGVK